MIVEGNLKFQGQSKILLILLVSRASNWRAASFYQNQGFTKLQDLNYIVNVDNSKFAQLIKQGDTELTCFAIPDI